MTDHRDEHETYGHTHSPVIDDLRKQVATLLDEQTGFRVAIAQLTAERDEARLEVCEWVEMDGATNAKEEAELRGWDCFKNAPVVKTLNGVVVSKGKAVPPKFELGDDDK